MTTTTTTPPSDLETGPAELVAAADQMLAELDEVIWAAKRPEEMLAAKGHIERLRSHLAGIDARLCVEIEASRAAETLQYASAADYLTAVTGGYHGAGRRWLRTATELCGDRAATQAALAAGEISVEQAEVIVKAVKKLPVATAIRDAAEAELLEHAVHFNASELKTLGDKLLAVLDPDGEDARDERALRAHERAAHLGRFLTITEDGLGGVKLKGRGTVEDAAWIKAAIASLAGPDPTRPDSSADADAAGAGGCDASAGRDTRDHSVRSWDALVEVCRRASAAHVLPTDHGQTPRLVLTMSLSDLQAGIGTATLATGGTLSAAAVRRLACDCDLIPAVLGANGEILDLGRSQRLVSTALFLALVLRDRHCSFPGCRRPPVACDAHHIQPWLDGGPTSLDNLTLLCRRHHTMLHTTGWQVRLNRHDRRPEYLPPPHLDPDRKPIRDRPLRQ